MTWTSPRNESYYQKLRPHDRSVCRPRGAPERAPSQLAIVSCIATADTSAEIEELQEEIATRYGFAITSHKHEMYGTCPECQQIT